LERAFVYRFRIAEPPVIACFLKITTCPAAQFRRQGYRSGHRGCNGVEKKSLQRKFNAASSALRNFAAEPQCARS